VTGQSGEIYHKFILLVVHIKHNMLIFTGEATIRDILIAISFIPIIIPIIFIPIIFLGSELIIIIILIRVTILGGMA
jgi:hypothetical protein